MKVSFGRFGWLIAAALLPAMLAGCNPARTSLEQFNCMYQQGQYKQAGEFSEKKAGKSPSGDNLLWALQIGATDRNLKKFPQSTVWFDSCEEMMKTFDVQWRETDVIGTTVVNDNIIPYRGQIYDGIMVNTYKALNFMALGDKDNARVEFNRAMERQTRAKDTFNAEIQRRSAKAEKANKKKSVDAKKTAESPETQSRIAKVYPELTGFEAYPDFVNPFSTYLGGVFFMVTGDTAKARDLLRESAGMAPNNQYVARDIEAVNKLMDGKDAEPTVWVFFENGLGPIKEEFRIDLPLFLVTRQVLYAGIALPKLVRRSAACDRLTIESQGKSYPTEIIGDMDRVVQTEFAKEFPWILTRAIIAAGAKAAAQNAILNNGRNDDMGVLAGRALAGIAVAAYSAATTAADVRIWSALPKNFQVAAMPMPSDGKLAIAASGGRTFGVSIESCRYAIVYVKMVSSMSEPAIEVIRY
jgi:hypothetical protein